eukprot:126647_1
MRGKSAVAARIKSKLIQALNVIGYSITENAIKEFSKAETRSYCIIISYHIIHTCIFMIGGMDVEHHKVKIGTKTCHHHYQVDAITLSLQGKLSQCCILWNHSKDFKETLE